MARTRRRPSRRPASVSLWALLAFPLLLTLMMFGINAQLILQASVAQQIVTDASALAAAQALVVDEHLIYDPSNSTQTNDLEQPAISAAKNYAAQNPLKPKPLEYQDGDITFSTVPNPLNQNLSLIDVVTVTGFRTADRQNTATLVGGKLFAAGGINVVTRSKGLLDRRVIGFRPVYGQPVPLVPIALAKADPTKGWKEQVDDVFTNAPPTTTAGLPTFTAKLGGTDQYDPYFLQFCDNCPANIAQQVSTGIAAQDFSAYGGAFLLPPGGSVAVTGAQADPNLAGIAAALNQLAAAKTQRAWPLYDGLDANNQPLIVGFVAARVVSVADNGDGSYTLTLVPTFMSDPSVATDSQQTNITPYLARVRLGL